MERLGQSCAQMLQAPIELLGPRGKVISSNRSKSRLLGTKPDLRTKKFRILNFAPHYSVRKLPRARHDLKALWPCPRSTTSMVVTLLCAARRLVVLGAPQCIFWPIFVRFRIKLKIELFKKQLIFLIIMLMGSQK
jgi:hypothetical protein